MALGGSGPLGSHEVIGERLEGSKKNLETQVFFEGPKQHIDYYFFFFWGGVGRGGWFFGWIFWWCLNFQRLLRKICLIWESESVKAQKSVGLWSMNDFCLVQVGFCFLVVVVVSGPIFGAGHTSLSRVRFGWFPAVVPPVGATKKAQSQRMPTSPVVVSNQAWCSRMKLGKIFNLTISQLSGNGSFLFDHVTWGVSKQFDAKLVLGRKGFLSWHYFWDISNHPQIPWFSGSHFKARF